MLTYSKKCNTASILHHDEGQDYTIEVNDAFQSIYWKAVLTCKMAREYISTDYIKVG